MLSPTERILFGLLVLICVVATINTFGQMYQIVTNAKGEKLRFDELPRRLWQGFIALITQGGMVPPKRRTAASIFHTMVAIGFLFFLLVNVVDLLEGFVEGFHIPNWFRLPADLFGTGVLIGMLYLILRRFAYQDPALSIRENVKLHPKARAGGIHQDSLVVGIFILVHIGFRLLSTSFSWALLDGGEFTIWMPVGSAISTLLAGLSPTALNFGWHFSWWVAVALVVLFLPYFPYTKHAHLFMGPLNFMTRPERNYLGEMQTLDFEDESIEQFGAATLFDYDQTRIVDALACIMCNRCQDACPAYNTGKELSPAAIEVNKRYFIKDNMEALARGDETYSTIPLLDFAISESALWACTACGACVDVCPVGNEPMQDIMDMRRNKVLMESEFPHELQTAFVGMERQGNPWNSTEDRMAWTEPLPFDVPTVQENPNFEYLLWVGCAGAFDPKAQEVVRAVATILNSAGVSFAVLGDAETCTGDSARRAGNEYLFYEMAMGNIETLNQYGVDKKKVVTSCPHCFSTIGNEYKELGGDYTVYHHTQMIADLVGQNKLRMNGSTLENVTFHDPCYLGRHNGIITDPRLALKEAGATLMEMDKSGTDSFCCGAGGAQMWKEEEHGETAVNLERFSHAQETGADTLAVGCPFCAQMMIDANQQAGSPMKVKDVAEIVVESLKVKA